MACRRPFAAHMIIYENRRSDHFGGGGNRQADEMALRRSFGLDIETRQPQRAADDVESRRQPSPISPRNQCPEINQDRRRYAERNDVGQRIELYAKLAGGIGSGAPT